jgi:glucokinase
MRYIALDIGGTKIYGGLLRSRGGKIEKTVRVPTRAFETKRGVREQIVNIVRSLWIQSVDGIGIGIAGHVDHKNGVVIDSPHIPSMVNMPLAQLLRREFHVPVLIDNDAHCFTLGEANFGQGKGFRNFAGITLGTGIGGGIVIDRSLYRGSQNAAGEFGHMKMSTLPIRCACNQFGHWEAFGSGHVLLALYARFSKQKMNAQEFTSLLMKKDGVAVKAMEVFGSTILDGFWNIVTMLNPEAIIVGGGLTQLDPLRKYLSKHFSEHLAFSSLTKTKLIFSRLNENANLLGASALF